MNEEIYKDHLWCTRNFAGQKLYYVFEETPNDFKSVEDLFQEMYNRYVSIIKTGSSPGVLAIFHTNNFIDTSVPYFNCDASTICAVNFGNYIHEFDKYFNKDKNSEHIHENKDGYKYDSGKARFDLIPVDALYTLALVYTKGSNKYPERNWENGMKWSRLYSAAQRHLSHFWTGEDIDKELNLPHLAQAAWNIINLLSYYLRGDGEDDRPEKERFISEIRKEFEDSQEDK